MGYQKQGFTDDETLFAHQLEMMEEGIIEAQNANEGGGLPKVTEEDNDKILQVVNGVWTAVSLAGSAVGTYIDEYINSALEGDY